MLKKNKSLAVPLFQKSHLVTKEFFFGLSLALFFHLFLLYLFRIAPISPPREASPLPFTTVEAVVTPPVRKTLPLKTNPLPLFSKESPSFKELPFPSTEIQPPYQEAYPLDPDFSLIEKIPYIPPSHDL